MSTPKIMTVDVQYSAEVHDRIEKNRAMTVRELIETLSAFDKSATVHCSTSGDCSQTPIYGVYGYENNRLMLQGW